MSAPRYTSVLILASATSSLFAAEKITYDDDIYPIFESKCLNCHNPDKKKGDLNLATYTGTMAGSSGGKIALAGDGGSSKLFAVTAHTAEPVMPPEGEKIARKDADLIRAWIDGGLLENKGSKAKKRKKPAFDLGAVPTGEKPDGPPPMPGKLLLEPVVTPGRATVVADMEASPWAPLLAVTAPHQVLLYHSESLELLGILPFPKGNPETLSFHPSGKYLLAGGGVGGKSGTTVTWDITSGEIMMTMGREFDSVLAADLRADLGGIALGGPSRLIKLWDPEIGEQIKSIKKHTDWVTAVAYSPDGVLLATGDRNNGVQIWEAFSGNEFHSLRGHQDSITDLKWRADSNLVASASEDGTIRFWDMNRGREIKKGNAGPGVLALDYARNGKLISVGRDRRVKLWKPDLSVEKQSQPASALLTEVAFSHDAARYFTADWNGHIEVWNTADFKKVGELDAAPPSIASRLTTLAGNESDLKNQLVTLRRNSETAQKAVDDALARIGQSEGHLEQLRKKANSLKQEANALDSQSRQLDQQAKAKLQKRDQLAKEADKKAEDPRVKTLTNEHAALITRRDEARQTRDQHRAKSEAMKARLPQVQEQIAALRKSIPQKKEAAEAAKGEVEKIMAEQSRVAERIKKWQAAAILTDLLQIESEIKALRAEVEEEEDGNDPAEAARVAELEKLRDALSRRLQDQQ